MTAECTLQEKQKGKVFINIRAGTVALSTKHLRFRRERGEVKLFRRRLGVTCHREKGMIAASRGERKGGRLLIRKQASSAKESLNDMKKYAQENLFFSTLAPLELDGRKASLENDHTLADNPQKKKSAKTSIGITLNF